MGSMNKSVDLESMHRKYVIRIPIFLLDFRVILNQGRAEALPWNLFRRCFRTFPTL